jgi:hypothetical protein
MNSCQTWLAVACAATAFASPCRAASNEDMLKDLGAVIALLGLPCGQVVSATRTNDNDHAATCSDGHRYRVFINAAGRVVAAPQ